MAARSVHFVVFLVLFFLLSVSCFPESGIKKLHLNNNHTYGAFSKTMNKGYSVAIKGTCSGNTGSIQIMWRLEVSECAEWFSFLKDDDIGGMWNAYANHSLTGADIVTCGSAIHLEDVSDTVQELIVHTTESPSEETNDNENDEDSSEKTTASSPKSKTVKVTSSKAPSKKASSEKPTKTTGKVSSTAGTKPRSTSTLKPSASAGKKTPAPSVNDRRKRRSENTDETEKSVKADEKEQTKQGEEAEVVKTPTKEAKQTEKGEKAEGVLKKTKEAKKTEKGKHTDDKKVDNRVCVTKHDGVFLLIVNAFQLDEEKGKDFQLDLTVEMKGKHGFLSASDWPLYPFYGFMSLLYVFYGVVWLVVSACQWRDLLRIQFWIGGVIALGMLEKAVFFSEYNNINITGVTNPSLTIFAELVSCVKRTLARILVIIVSMGFGIVKPRLGTTLHRVLGIGALYFILAAIEGCFRSLHPKSDPGRQQLIASIPLAVLDASICWWIFMSLVQTTRTLRIRRNLVKLSLYRHFTNTLIFAVLASVAYMIWSIKTHRFAKDNCITDWSELWLDEAFWHFLFSIVLLVIMVLWRPTANNQRYAFTPIVDFGDDDEDDDNMTLSDAFDGMKMRNVKNVPEVYINGDSKRKHKPEDDLKWVEENIPSSAADAVLPSVLDSDEELMTTKFEMSKME